MTETTTEHRRALPDDASDKLKAELRVVAGKLEEARQTIKAQEAEIARLRKG